MKYLASLTVAVVFLSVSAPSRVDRLSDRNVTSTTYLKEKFDSRAEQAHSVAVSVVQVAGEGERRLLPTLARERSSDELRGRSRSEKRSRLLFVLRINDCRDRREVGASPASGRWWRG